MPGYSCDSYHIAADRSFGLQSCGYTLELISLLLLPSNDNNEPHKIVVATNDYAKWLISIYDRMMWPAMDPKLLLRNPECARRILQQVSKSSINFCTTNTNDI